MKRNEFANRLTSSKLGGGVGGMPEDESSLIRKRQRRSTLLGLLLVIGYLALTVAVMFWIESRQARQEWEEFVAKVEANGGTLDIEKLRPKPVPDEDNFAKTPLFAEIFEREEPFRIDAMEPGQMEVLSEPDWPGRGKGVYKGNSFVSRRPPLTNVIRDENELEDSEAAEIILKQYEIFQAEIKELERAVSKPHARFPIRWGSLDPDDSPHLSRFQTAVVVFKYRSLANLRMGNFDAGFEDLLTMLRLSRLAADEPKFLNVLVGGTIQQVSHQNLWEGLESRCWNEEQLSMLEEQLGSLNWTERFQESLRIERATFCSLIENPGELRRELVSVGARDWLLRLLPRAYLYRAATKTGEIQEVLFSKNGGPRKEVSIESIRAFRDAFAASRESDPPQRNFLLSFAQIIPDRAFDRIIWFQATLNNCRCAIALERFFLNHQTYPRSLEELVPGYLSKLPNDIVNGEPLRYLLRDDGRPCVYSVGFNTEDEGGEPSKDFSKGDWVFQYLLPEGYDWRQYYDDGGESANTE